MANCMLSFLNYADSASASGGSWLSAMPLSNILSRVIGLKARSSNDNASSTQFELNLGSAKAVRVVGVIGHNLSSGATYRIRSSSVAGNFTSPLYDSTTLNIGDQTYDIIHVLPAASTARYWLVEMTDTSNPSNYVEVGRVFLGDVFQPAVNMEVGAKLGWEDQSTIEMAYDGTEYFDEKKTRRYVELIFSGLTDAEAYSTLLGSQRDCGITSEIMFIWDPSDATYFKQRTFLSRNEQLSPIEAARYGVNTIAMKLRELL